MPRINDAVAKRVGIAPAAVVGTAADSVGDLGCAQPLAMLDDALRVAAPGALILVAAFGSGCDVLLLKRTDAPCPGTVPDGGKPETSYLKYLSFTGQLPLAWGMRAEMDNKTALTAAWRDHARMERFEGGECSALRHAAVPALAAVREPRVPRAGHAAAGQLRRPAGEGAVAHQRLPGLHARARRSSSATSTSTAAAAC